MTKIAIFASGSGTNAENIIRYFNNHPSIKVALVVSNNPHAYVLTRVAHTDVPSIVLKKEALLQPDMVLPILSSYEIQWIVLAGFLLKIPSYLVNVFFNRIINIHPALLPKFGGKGMYGHFVHQAVIEAHAHESGITIHFVNDQYDEGNIIFQASFAVLPSDQVDDVENKVHSLEQEYFPQVIEQTILSSKQSS
ncbi:MAG: phosphoribosylglycinamide formyltransferase [Microbacter sp.]